MSNTDIKDRYVNRRKMAWISFYFLLVVGLGLLFFGLWSDTNAQRVDVLSFLIGMVTGVPTTIVVAYFGVTAVTDQTEIKTEAKKPPPPHKDK